MVFGGGLNPDSERPEIRILRLPPPRGARGGSGAWSLGMGSQNGSPMTRLRLSLRGLAGESGTQIEFSRLRRETIAPGGASGDTNSWGCIESDQPSSHVHLAPDRGDEGHSFA